jgi:hypothetical protein
LPPWFSAMSIALNSDVDLVSIFTLLCRYGRWLLPWIKYFILFYFDISYFQMLHIT